MPDRNLFVIGDGPDLKKIRARAGSNVKILGHQPFEKLRTYMQDARAFVFAAEEDFGIVSVEAQACGTPVVAYGRGGLTESVVDGVTGVFFNDQTVESLVAGVKRFEFESQAFDPHIIRENSERFSVARFRTRMQELVEREWDSFQSNLSQEPMRLHAKNLRRMPRSEFGLGFGPLPEPAVVS